MFVHVFENFRPLSLIEHLFHAALSPYVFVFC